MFSFTADHRFRVLDRLIRKRFIQKRHRMFSEKLNILPRTRVVDLGGRLAHWNDFQIPIDVTLINLEPELPEMRAHGSMQFQTFTADIAALDFRIPHTDVIYCNSVLEHIDGSEKRQICADAIRNTGTRYWIQIPSVNFPLEAHCRLMFWWIRSENFRKRKMLHWEGHWPFMAQQMSQTFPLTENELRELFPDGAIIYERFLGVVKSIICYRN